MQEGIEEFLKACSKKFCPECGAPVVDTRASPGRRRTFCSEKCRWAFDKRKKRKELKKMKEDFKNEDTRVTSDPRTGSEASSL